MVPARDPPQDRPRRGAGEFWSALDPIRDGLTDLSRQRRRQRKAIPLKCPQ